MHGKRRIFCAVLLLFVMAALCAASQQRPKASDLIPQTISIDAQGASAGEILQKLSAQIHRPVVLDGHLDNKISLHFEGPVAEVLKSIGRVLDLDIREGKHGAVLLVRRFDRDLSPPQAQREEIHALAETALRVLPQVRPFSEPDDWTDDLRAFAATFNASQVAALKAGGRLNWNDFDPSQRQRLASVLNARLFGTSRYAWSLVFQASQEPRNTKLALDEPSGAVFLEARELSGSRRIYLGVRLGGDGQ